MRRCWQFRLEHRWTAEIVFSYVDLVWCAPWLLTVMQNISCAAMAGLGRRLCQIKAPCRRFETPIRRKFLCWLI